MCSKTNYLGLILFLLIGMTTNINAQGVSVDNGRLFFNSAPGETESREITLTNPTDKPVLLQMSFKDWNRDTFGVKQYAEPGQMKHSCAEWASVDQMSIELAPRSEKVLKVDMKPPSNVTSKNGVYNTMLFIKQIKDPYTRVASDGNLKSSINANFQIGIHLYYIHPSLKQKELSIQGFTMDADQKASQLLLKLENVGETVVDGNVKLELTHKDSGKEYRLFDTHPVTAAFMPSDIRVVSLELPENIPSGNYSALAIVDIGSDHELQMAVIEIEIPK